MGYVIAMAGKGGTGKTTIAALITRLIKEKKLGSVLAVDADPNSNLAECLGLKVKATVGKILDDIAAAPGKIPSGMPKETFIEYEVQTAVSEGEGFDVLTMGRPEGPGCYCYVNNVLRNIMGRLINNYDFVIIDNEAGLEHLSRRTTRRADTLLVISDASKVGLKSAKRINELTKELDIKIGNSFLLLNRKTEDVGDNLIQESGLEHLGDIPIDVEITKISLNGNSMMELRQDSLSLKRLEQIGDKIWRRNQ